MQPIISIITVCLNAAEALERTILSIVSQTMLAGIEYIVIDGKSEDQTPEVLKQYISYIDRWVCEQDSGIYDAMNKGISLSHGQWLLFLNAGDTLYAPNTLQEITEHLPTSEKIKVLYGDYATSHAINKAYPLTRIKKHMPFCHQSALFRNQGVQFSTNYIIASDYAWVRALYEREGAEAFVYLPITIAHFDTTGLSSNHIQLQRKEYLKIYTLYPERGLYYWCYWLLVKLRVAIRFGYARR